MVTKWPLYAWITKSVLCKMTFPTTILILSVVFTTLEMSNNHTHAFKSVFQNYPKSAPISHPEPMSWTFWIELDSLWRSTQFLTDTPTIYLNLMHDYFAHLNSGNSDRTQMQEPSNLIKIICVQLNLIISIMATYTNRNTDINPIVTKSWHNSIP